MPRHEFVYDPALKSTPEWKYLYAKWCYMRKASFSKDFERFQDFYDWATSTGYVYGAKLKRFDDDKPYGPDNCFWKIPNGEDPDLVEDKTEWISRWNETVNRIRVHYGMTPF